MTLQDLLHSLASIGDDIGKIWAGVGVIAVIGAAIGTYLFKSGKKQALQAANQIPITLSLDDLARLVETRLNRGNHPGPPPTEGRIADIDEFKKSLAYISAYRELFEPPQLTAEKFPKELDVLAWAPGKTLKVRVPTPTGARIILGLFCLPHYIVFPGFAGQFLLTALMPGYGFYVGAVIGLLLWVRMNHRGVVLTIDFEKRRHTIVSPTSISTQNSLPRDLSIVEGAFEGQPALALALGTMPLLHTSAAPESRARLVDFANSLLWAMGNQIEAAPGVYFGPIAQRLAAAAG